MVGCNTPGVTGRLPEVVSPVTVTTPVGSTAIPLPSSCPPPPKNVENSSAPFGPNLRHEGVSPIERRVEGVRQRKIAAVGEAHDKAFPDASTSMSWPQSVPRLPGNVLPPPSSVEWTSAVPLAFSFVTKASWSPFLTVWTGLRRREVGRERIADDGGLTRGVQRNRPAPVVTATAQERRVDEAGAVGRQLCDERI